MYKKAVMKKIYKIHTHTQMCLDKENKERKKDKHAEKMCFPKKQKKWTSLGDQ